MEIKRDIYVERLKRRMGNQQIKVITGIRRCGKSFLLFRLFKDIISRNFSSCKYNAFQIQHVRSPKHMGVCQASNQDCFFIYKRQHIAHQI